MCQVPKQWARHESTLTLFVDFLGNSLDETSAKNINVHLTAQAHQWSLIVVLSRFAQEKQLKGMIRLTIIYTLGDNETSQGPVRHAQVWFGFMHIHPCVPDQYKSI